MSLHHSRAIELAKRRLIEPLSDQESLDLESHLSRCNDCACEAQELVQGVKNLRTVRPLAAAHLVRATQLRCKQRAYDLEMRNRKMFGIVVAGIISSAWILLSIPFVWGQLSSFGSGPDLLLHLSFILMWFMPAMIAGAVALWLKPQLSAEQRFPQTAFSGTLEAAPAVRKLR